MHSRLYYFIVAVSFPLLLSCGGSESPFKPEAARINLYIQNSSGVQDTDSVTDTVERIVRVGMVAYLPSYITKISVTIAKGASDTDTALTFLGPIAWTDTQWIRIAFHSIGTRTVTVIVSVKDEQDKYCSANIIVAGKPIKIVDPVSTSADEDSSALFFIKTSGAGQSFFYQWWKDGAPVSNATRDTLIINPVLVSSAGRYTCVIKDQWGDSVTSAPALLTVIQSSAVNHKPLLAIKGTSNVLAGQTCQLTLSATDPDAGQILTYKVVSGPAGGSLADTTYQWTPPTGFVGLDTVVFSVTDNGAPPMSDSATIILTVSSSPTKADFTPSAMTGEYPLTVTFTNNSVNATSFSWDFGDGIASTDKNPIHTFSAPGTFTVRLLATGVTVDSLKKAIVVTRPAAPTSVAADSGVTWIRVTWTKGSASVSDTVYFAAGDTVTESGATKIANAVSPCLIRNLKVGQEYSIAVTSTTNKGAVSDFSFVVRKTTALPRGMKKILAQAKSFSMGQTGKAEPVHNVTFTHNFWMDSAEVTQKDYVSLMTATYQNFSATAPSLLPTDGDNYPEYVITWCDAALYCNARSKRDGLDTIYRYSSITGIPGNGCALGTIMYDSLKANGYHLPTEAQWEFACRAGTTTTYYWGSDTSGASQYEWYFPLGNLSTVASKKPNGFGLYDMLGNAMEFVNDYYDSTYDYYQPVDPLGPPLPSLNVNIVCRGANGSMQLAACASRRPAQPEYPWDFGACGFRVCYTDKY